MNSMHGVALISHDEGLLKHWTQAFGGENVIGASDLQALEERIPPQPLLEDRRLVWIDATLPHLPSWTNSCWKTYFKHFSIIFASSNPENNAAIAALGAGCMAYCHAYSDTKTLQIILQTVQSGHTWVGKELMQLLVAGASKAAQLNTAQQADWGDTLTAREKEISILAANGASNSAIAVQCGITERTVKAHISSTFEKLNLTDRLQLALKVHGIN